MRIRFSFFIALLMNSLHLYAGSARQNDIEAYQIHKVEDIVSYLPMSKEHIQKRVDFAIAKFQEAIVAIVNVPEERREFSNTALAFDHACGILQTEMETISAMMLVVPNLKDREAAYQAVSDLKQAYSKIIGMHPQLYDVMLSLERAGDAIPADKVYFFEKIKLGLKHEGLGLSDKKRERIRSIQQELANLSMAFQRNISEDQSHIWVSRQQLYGLSQEFIRSLKHQGGQCKLTCDYPIYFQVMKFCKNSDVRKRLYEAFQNRAYPQNEAVLEAMIFKRDELAKELGYVSYADFDLKNQMIKSEKNAHRFVDEMLERVLPIARREFNQLISDLPEGVYLTDEGRLHAYDRLYTMNYYKQKHFDIDERIIAQYFPIEETLKGLMKVYEAFFNLSIKEEKVSNLWSEDVRLLSIREAKSQSVLGYILLDLFPRKGKYGHACNCPMIPAYKTSSGQRLPALTLVVTNFPKSQVDHPSLLSHSEVKTFFHEFGHALHNVLGSTDLMMACGTNVEVDFVELPSQLLEEWMYEPEIIASISHHYQTHQPMPQQLITKLIEARGFLEGMHWVRQCYLAKLSLEFYKEGASKNTNMIEHQLREKILFDSVDPDDLHFHNAFGHLDEYGPKYYGYMWSKVFALDIFGEIKKEGILNPKAGERYVREILGRGGTEDPNLMLYRYLDREPSLQPFIRQLGGEK